MKVSIKYIFIIILWPALLFSQKKTFQPVNSNPTAAKAQTPVSSSTIQAKAEVPVTKNSISTYTPSLGTINASANDSDPKEYVRAISQRMTDAWKGGQPELVTNIVDQEIPGCSTQPDSNYCKGSIWFTGGYLFQTGFEQNDTLAEKYKDIAQSYYSRVLEIFPENQNVLSNMIRLYEHSSPDPSTFEFMKEIADNFPQQRINYLMRIGDLYLMQHDTTSASKYYLLAYAEDPWSEAACGRIVNLYIQYGFFPGEKASTSAVTAFIYSCQDVGLSNFSEDMARQQIIYTLKKSEITSEQIISSLLIWTDILAENDWIEERRVENLRFRFFDENKSHSRMDSLGNQVLKDLVEIVTSKNPKDLNQNGFWFNDKTEFRLPNQDMISTRSVFLKVLHNIGKKAYFSRDVKRAENFWHFAFQYAGDFDPMTILLGKELAQLYTGDPGLDRNGEKMSAVIDHLFSGKGNSYSYGNKEMIREFHLVLGRIFYDQKKFSSYGYDNAEFQLSRALSPDLGPIINPEMRIMLANVYETIGRPESMMKESILAIQDLLRLDGMEEADKMIHDTEQKTAGLPEIYINQLGALDGIRKLRSNCADPEGISFPDQSAVHHFLVERQKQQDHQSSILDPRFVKEQYFKALSDKAQFISDDHAIWQQQIYSQALIRIADQDQLGSYDDYIRLQNIRQSLMGTMINPEQLSVTRFNKAVNYEYKESTSVDEYKSFVIPTMGQVIQIPQSMFRLNEAVTDYYKPTVDNPQQTTMMPRIQYEARTFKVINRPDAPKEEIQEPVNKQIIPQQRMQSRIVNEKDVIMMKGKYKG